MLLEVKILGLQEVVFEGQAKSVSFPGEQGVFEILPFHKRLVSRLIAGTLFVDDKAISIKRGVVQVDQNNISAVVEEAGNS
jgi:F-type H+-transporting ATPase subunit epsilon